jgi:hypothetical protein
MAGQAHLDRSRRIAPVGSSLVTHARSRAIAGTRATPSEGRKRRCRSCFGFSRPTIDRARPRFIRSIANDVCERTSYVPSGSTLGRPIASLIFAPPSEGRALSSEGRALSSEGRALPSEGRALSSEGRALAKVVRWRAKVVRYQAKVVRYQAKVVRYQAKVVRYQAKVVRYQAKVDDRRASLAATRIWARRGDALHRKAAGA